MIWYLQASTFLFVANKETGKGVEEEADVSVETCTGGKGWTSQEVNPRLYL